MLKNSLLLQCSALEQKEIELDAKKFKLQEKVYKSLLLQLRKTIKRFQGQRFALRIKGFYSKKVKKSVKYPAGVKAVPFDYFFVGQFEKKRHRLALDLFDSNYQHKSTSLYTIPIDKVYLAKNDSNNFKLCKEPLMLNYANQDQASWHLEQILSGLMPYALKTFLDVANRPEVTWIAGNEAFDAFVSKQSFPNRRMIKKLKL